MSLSSESAAPERAGYVYALLTVAIWAGFVLVTRIAGTSPLSAWDVTALRFGTAALVLLPAWWLHLRVPLFTARMFALAAIGGIGYALLVYAGFRYAPAAHGALLVSGLLPFTMAFSVWLILEQTPSRALKRGLALIAIGVAFLAFDTFVRHGADLRGSSVWIGDLLLVGASLAWALYSALIRKWNVKPWETTIGVALLSTLLYLPVYALWLPHGFTGVDAGAIVLQAIYQGIFVVIIAMVLYMQAMQRLGPARLGAFMAVVPAIAGIGASLALGEPLNAWLIAGLLLTSAGAWVSVRR